MVYYATKHRALKHDVSPTASLSSARRSGCRPLSSRYRCLGAVNLHVRAGRSRGGGALRASRLRHCLGVYPCCIIPNRSIDCYALNGISFCHLSRHFSVTMEPHCALKVTRHLLKNKRHYHHNAIDRFGFSSWFHGQRYESYGEKANNSWEKEREDMSNSDMPSLSYVGGER